MKKLNSPLVKIGVPTYNRPGQLKIVLDWLLSQPYKNIEVYVSDNHTPGMEVFRLLVDTGLKDSRLNFKIQYINRGPAANFNFVYQWAGTSPYFMFMADDDSYADNYIEACVSFLEEHRDYILCAGTTIMVKGNTHSIKVPHHNIASNSPIRRMLNLFIGNPGNAYFYGIFRNDPQVEGFSNFSGADWLWLAKMALSGKITNISNTTMWKSDDGASSTRRKMVQDWSKNKLQSVFFETYTAWQIASRLPYTVVVFVFLNFKFLSNSIKRLCGFFLSVLLLALHFWL